GDPRPGLPGTLETFTTPPLPPGAWYFKVKVLTDGSSQGQPVGVADHHSYGGASAAPHEPPGGQPGSPDRAAPPAASAAPGVTARAAAAGSGAEVVFPPL